jgi:hypothetical protein
VLPTDGVADDEVPRCSAKGCREPATIVLTWRNPRIHVDGRTKQWLACDAHADDLAQFLGVRSFLLERTPLAP